ncbi:hypothetical protein [Mycobacteroides salmoniphilum]|uniref:hypothetical protein n=1 Tax=Mycobacteroides salmoniphilum TaxID=404941 RepID=UPI0010669C89|nr:hypothetical protein [Mycobacteroides salmoniphilum]TDZ91173.1 hypothetical protein CCUG62472_04432 [Mycobacteroides salmoniphilum]
MLGINALDYFLGLPGRTWPQFLEHFDSMCQELGTRCWARAATDPELRRRVEEMDTEQIRELREQSTSEPHYGYTPIIRELRNLCDQLIAHRGQAGGATARDLSFMPRPAMVGDLINERESELVRADLDETIAEAHASWERMQHDEWEVW